MLQCQQWNMNVYLGCSQYDALFTIAREIFYDASMEISSHVKHSIYEIGWPNKHVDGGNAYVSFFLYFHSPSLSCDRAFWLCLPVVRFSEYFLFQQRTCLSYTSAHVRKIEKIKQEETAKISIGEWFLIRFEYFYLSNYFVKGSLNQIFAQKFAFSY